MSRFGARFPAPGEPGGGPSQGPRDLAEQERRLRALLAEMSARQSSAPVGGAVFPPRIPLPGTPGHTPFVGTPQIPPLGTPGRESFLQPQEGVSSVPGAGVEGSTLPRFFFPQGPAAAPPISNQAFLAQDPSRTVGAGSLAGLAGMMPFLLAGGGGGLNLGGFNQALAARQASAEADLRSEADAQRLALRQDLARRGILSSGLAAGAEADISGALVRGLGAARAGILGAGAQADLASQQLGANQELERRRMIFSLLQSIPGLAQALGGLAA